MASLTKFWPHWSESAGAMNSVLIVDDDSVYSHQLEKLLSGRYFVHAVETLAQAIKIFGTVAFNAVVLDLGLPDTHIDDTVSRMKKEYPDCAIVVLSGHEDPERIKRCIRDSASSYLIKGRDDKTPDMLAAAINTAMLNNEKNGKVEQVRKLIENGTEI